MGAAGEQKLADQQRTAVVVSYTADPFPSMRSLARRFGVSSSTIRGALQGAGVPIRTRAEQREFGIAAGSIGMPRRVTEAIELIDQVTPERWRELYWGAGSGFPSVKELASHFAVDPTTIRARLRAAGLTLRTRSEQARLEFRSGKRKPAAHGRGGLPKGTAPAWMHNLPPAVERRRRRKISEAKRVRVLLPCAWCGTPVERAPWRVRGAVTCCKEHRGSAAMHRRWRGPAAPRPLIVERLCAMLEDKGPRHTYRMAAREAEQIGAQEPEILEALQKLWQRVLAREERGG